MADKSHLENLYDCYLSGQYGERTFQWHCRHTEGFAEYVEKQREE